ncbi:beta-lactamase/transpeptidase-like protein [Nemania sp. FL0916]|nr:beta-lactamase/transpeptidase-like protein [Nemania sp. FL0916]
MPPPLTNPLAKQLDDISPLIDSLRAVSGAPGLSVGVIHNYKILHESYHGHRDVTKGLKVDRDTMFYVAPLTKAITATALGILVDDGLLQWTTPVHRILPKMSQDSELYSAKLTVLDILRHRTGKACADALFLQSNNDIKKQDVIPIFDHLAQVEPVRSTYMYNDHAYNIANLVIEKVSEQSWGDFVDLKIFKPLGMTRSFIYRPSDDNVALPYNILTNKEPWPLPLIQTSRDTLMLAGQVRTSITDLLKYSKANLQALSTITPRGPLQKVTKIKPMLPNNPIREISTIMRPHIAHHTESILERTCAIGWNRTVLPGSLDFGWNKQILGHFPELGQRYPGKLVIWHGGNMPGSTAAMCLVPETGTAVVILQNSLGLCDVADWACQSILDTIFLGNPAQDYFALALKCAQKSVTRMELVEQKLSEERILGTEPRPLILFCGRYFNRISKWFMDISQGTGQEALHVKFLGLDSEKYYLRHYHHNTFTWNLTYDEMAKRGQYIRDHEYYKLTFELDSEGEVEFLRWKHDKSVPEGELFCRAWGPRALPNSVE